MSTLEQLIEALQHEEVQMRWEAVGALAQAADQGDDLAAAVPALAGALADASADLRQRAAYALVSVAEHGGDISPALPALAQALGDESEDVRREVVWALYCLAYAGADIEAAVPGLERCLQDESRSVRGNGAIGLTLQYLNAGQAEAAEKLLTHADGSVIFGAAWGHTDHYRQKTKKAELQALIQRIRPGLLDIGLRDGLAGALSWARERGEDISFALAVIQEMLAQTNDPLVQAPLYGILMKLDPRD